jgi:hypothetical protein
VQLSRHFSGVAATVRDGAHIRVTPTSVGEAAPAKADATSRTASTWAFPWLLLVLAVVLTSLVRGIRWYRQRGQRGHPPAAPPTTTAVP